MHTAAAQKTDRVFTYNASVPMACYLGDAPNRNRWLNFLAVSYEGLRGEDFSAIVWDAGSDKLRVALYNFTEKSLDGLMRVWRLDHGRYKVIIGPDANDDGLMDSVASEKTVELQRYSPLEFAFPPKQVGITQVELLEKLDNIMQRTDLAISPLDTRLGDNDFLEVRLHNIGAKPAKNVRIVIERNGKVIEEKTVSSIDAPLDLNPRVATSRFKFARSDDVIVVDPDNAIPEIAEHNNRLLLSARKSPK